MRKRDTWQPICSQRARKLRKRGEQVKWDSELEAFTWLFHPRNPHQNSEEITP